MNSTLYVIYGSEADVLTHFLKNCDGQKLKIYNNRVPLHENNTISCKIDDFTDALEEMIGLHEIKKICFIGAGFLDQSKLLVQETSESIDAQIQTNITNYIQLTNILLPYMMKRKYGRFIYLSSIRSEIGGQGASIYSASKAFGENFYKAIGQEYGRFGITTGSIRMGYFETRMLNKYDTELKDVKAKKISLGRFGNSEDLTRSIKHIIDSDYINSGIIDLNGGLIYE